jgi:PAS domain S-box-containing protein
MPRSAISSAPDPVRPAIEASPLPLVASALLPTGGSVADLLTAILDLAARIVVADAYAIWQSHDNGASWDRLEHRGLAPSYPTRVPSKATSLPEGVQILEDAGIDPLSPETGELRRNHGIASMLAAPLGIDGRNTGLLIFYWRDPHKFLQSDTDHAVALANISANALTLSLMYEKNQREKRRLAFLAEASAVLSSSLDYERTLEQVVHLAVPHIADWCAVYMQADDGSVNRIEIAHADPSWRERQREFEKLYPTQIRPDRGVGGVLRTGKPEIIPHITEEMIAATARDPEHLRRLREFRVTSAITIPLISRAKTLGALVLVAAGGDRHFTPDDVQLAEDLSHRAAAAIENAKLHRALVEQQNALRLAHSAAKMGSWGFDLVKMKPSWSEEFKALHGLPLEAEPSFEAGANIVHPDDREHVLQQLTDALASNSDQITSEHRTVTPDGRVVWVHSSGRIERDNTGKALAIAGISMDVTERRLAEEALRRTEKIAAAGRLAATVAHEVNNPLESIINLIYISKHTPGLPAEVAQHLTAAESELSRLAQIVRQTLGFYRESTLPAGTDIGLIVGELLDLYRARILARSIQLSPRIAPGMMAHVIAGEIKQVVANLLANAIDATGPGGSIQVAVQSAGSCVDIVIADTGTGISDAHLAHLFEPFFTTKAEVGTGLGLWVSKGIVEKHHGHIAVVSNTQPPNQGTTFTVSLPLA